MNNYLISIILLISSTIFAQPERFTKGAENGYAWIAMENSGVVYSDIKYKLGYSLLYSCLIFDYIFMTIRINGIKE